jgi:hypothetical protein
MLNGIAGRRFCHRFGFRGFSKRPDDADLRAPSSALRAVSASMVERYRTIPVSG